MQKLLGMLFLVAGASVCAMGAAPAPEIDAASAGSAFALLTGTVLVIRARRKK